MLIFFHPETDFRVELFKNQMVTVESQTKIYLVLNLDHFTSISGLLSRVQSFEPQFYIDNVEDAQPSTSTPFVDDMTEFYSSFTNLRIIRSYQVEQYKQMCTDFIFVEIPGCSFKVYNTLCRLHVIYKNNTFLDREGMRYFCLYDANRNVRGSISFIRLKEILQTLETHELLTETQFNALKSMDLEKTIHFYKTVVKVEKGKTLFERLKSFFVEDPKKNAFLKSRTYFVDSSRMGSQQSSALKDESQPSTSRRFVTQTMVLKRKHIKEKFLLHYYLKMKKV